MKYDTRRRDRQEWIEWGLLDVPALEDFVYETLPWMESCCKEDLLAGLQKLQIAMRSVDSKLMVGGIEPDRITALKNVKSCQLSSQIDLILNAIARHTDHVVEAEENPQSQLAYVADVLLTIVDESADPRELDQSLTDLKRLFLAAGRVAASDRVDRLRASWLPS